jgi:hypothetical protein
MLSLVAPPIRAGLRTSDLYGLPCCTLGYNYEALAEFLIYGRSKLTQPPDDLEDEAGVNWAAGIAREWADDLSDPWQDIYTLKDGTSEQPEIRK